MSKCPESLMDGSSCSHLFSRHSTDTGKFQFQLHELAIWVWPSEASRTGLACSSKFCSYPETCNALSSVARGKCFLGQIEPLEWAQVQAMPSCRTCLDIWSTSTEDCNAQKQWLVSTSRHIDHAQTAWQAHQGSLPLLFSLSCEAALALEHAFMFWVLAIFIMATLLASCNGSSLEAIL